MTYKLDPVIEKIEAPIVIIMPDGERLEYDSGEKAYLETFDKTVAIKRITAEEDKVVIELEEINTLVDSSLFDGA